MKTLVGMGIATFMMFTAACAEDAARTGTSEATQALGIASFKTDEQPTKITVVGLDAIGQEVARVELTHGVFTLSPAYREDYDTDQVDGRKLDATVNGHHYLLERAGYESLLHMPAFPASEIQLATLLADSHVKPILDRWQLGFKTASTNTAEDVFDTYTMGGSLVQTCNGASSCGTLTRTGDNAGTYSIGTCGGGAAASEANRIVMYTNSNVDEVSQCCPAGSGGQSTNWWAHKQCPKSGRVTQDCGTVNAGAACIGCGVFDASYSCTVTYSGSTAWSNYNATCPAQCYSSADCYHDDGCGGTCYWYTDWQIHFCF